MQKREKVTHKIIRSGWAVSCRYLSEVGLFDSAHAPHPVIELAFEKFGKFFTFYWFLTLFRVAW